MASQQQEEINTNVPRFANFSTGALHAGQEPERWNSRAVIPPISLSTTFKQDSPGEHHGFEYSRSGNPTQQSLEECIAKIEGGKYGMVFSSGLGCSSTLMMLMKTGDHIICMDDVYGGTNRLFSKVFTHFGLTFDFVDCRDVSLVEAKIVEGKTKMIWIETPTNPTMRIVDIENVSKVAHKYKDIIVVVDNTFMSPYFQRPLMWGADIAFNSVTKYINGHTDVVMGCVALNDEALYKRIKFLQNAAGAVTSPFDCFLVNRGAKTLAVRMERHQKNALAVAHYLEKHHMVLKVIYPGLKSHPQHELVKKQCTGYSGMISFEIKGDLETAKVFLRTVKMFCLAESLGGIESLIEHPAIMTHASVDPADRVKLGISDTFIRLSVGIEDIEDLIDDVSKALDASENSNQARGVAAN